MRAADLLVQKGMDVRLAPYAGALLAVLEANGIVYRITSVLRSRAHQEALYARYRAGIHQFPVAPPGSSLHEVGWAMDVTMPEWVYPQLGAIWRSWGGKWWAADRIHFSV